MKRYQGRIKAISQLPGGRPVSRIQCPKEAIPAPGQPLLALRSGGPPRLRHNLYPIEIHRDGFRCLAPIQARWGPGDQLDLLGPIGRGFSPPGGSRRWFLMSHQADFSPLLPLLNEAEAQDIEVAIVTAQAIGGLAEHVEVLTEAAPALDWADFTAVCTSQAGLMTLRQQLGRYRDLPLPCPVQVLFQDPLPCGFGGCLCCGLNTSSGWSLRCQQGPVFDLEQLNV